jgi:hypothetical protein
MKQIRLIAVHCRPDAGYDLRYDTTMMVSMGVAALNRVAYDLLGYTGVAIDETYMGAGIPDAGERAYLLALVSDLVEGYLIAGDTPVVMCTLLSYNALGTDSFLRELKQRFGARLTTGVGGQHVTMCSEACAAWRTKPYVDCLANGDAEVTLQLLLSGQTYAEGKKAVKPLDHYARPYYGGYVGLEDRLEEMSHLNLRGLRNIRMLLTESVRGCSWAVARKEACEMCALDVLLALHFRGFPEHFAIESELVASFGINWIFDVSNQWIPVQGPAAQVKWLERYCAAKARYGGPNVSKYVYLTTNSVTAETAPLLRQAGVDLVYVGIDGWDARTRRELHKTQYDPFKMLDAAKASGLLVRTSMVIGSGVTADNVRQLPKFVKEILNGYGDTVISFGTFTEIILPGAENWRQFREQCFSGANELQKGRELFASFDVNGFLDLDQQDELNLLRIRHTQAALLDDILSAKAEAEALIAESEVIAVDIRHGDHLEVDS